MPRKLRFDSKKYNQRVKRKKEERGNATAELHVSLPLPSHFHLCENLSSLKRVLKGQPLPEGWVEIPAECNLVYAKLDVDLPLLAANASLVVKISEGLNWNLSCHGILVEIGQCQALNVVPARLISDKAVLDLLSSLQSLRVCQGSPVSDFKELVEARGGVFMDSTGERQIARIDTWSGSIRHVACELLISPSTSSARCRQCMCYRGSLRVMSSRMRSKSSNRTDPHSHTPYRALSTEEMKMRMKNLHAEFSRIVKQRNRLRKKLDARIEKSGINVSEKLCDDLRTIMENEGSKAMENEDTTYFQKVFWQQQLLASSKTKACGMRWHPYMIKWCLYLRAHSQGAYETLRQSRVISLPSQRTLRDYTHHLKPDPGFSAEVDAQLMSAMKLDKCAERDKCVLMLMDEMYVKQDLVYSKQSGEIVGFTNLGDINAHLLEFERSVSSEENSREPLARTVMEFMVKGLFKHLEFPYTHFPCHNPTAVMLVDPFWEAVYRLELLGLKVLGATFDGASINRSFVKLHSSEKKLVNKILNPFSAEARQFFFIFDPPHLIKTTRNCWASKARNLWNDGKDIKWGHIWSLYYKNRTPTGLSFLPKLKYEHIKLNSFSKMRVDIAAQVLSYSVSKGLTHVLGSTAEGTARFTDMFDKFFDTLNVSNFDSGKHKRKSFQNPYRSASDFRLKWLEEDFLSYLDNWRESVRSREGYTDSEKKRMLLSEETESGLRLTVKSFVELVRYIFTIPGVKVFLSRNICQDPLEKFFGCQRQMGATHDNPTVMEFQRNSQALRVVNSFCKDIIKGNCRGNKRGSENIDDCDQPLPKRFKSRSK